MEEFAIEKKTLVHDNLGSSSTNSFVCTNCCSQVNMGIIIQYYIRSEQE